MKRMLLAVALLVCVSTSGFAMQMMDWNWIEQKAEHGDVAAMLTLAHQIQDQNQAAQWYRRAADQNNPEAEYWMGKQYMGGNFGTNREEAIKWLSRAAMQGYPDAQQAMAELNAAEYNPNNPGGTVMGVPNIGRDPMERLLHMAERGDVEAMFRLGQKLFNGGAGSGHDERAAFMWFQKAANAGYTPAMHQLAQMYGRGIGVRQDTNKARYWDMMADRHGGGY